jgi:hypothetical protein
MALSNHQRAVSGAKRKAREYTRFQTMKTRRLTFAAINPHAVAYPTQESGSLCAGKERSGAGNRRPVLGGVCTESWDRTIRHGTPTTAI